MKNTFKKDYRNVLRMSIVMILFITSIPSVAQWATNPYINNTICTAPSGQNGAVIASDGSGGAIIAWVDYRLNSQIYVQRIDINGTIQWAVDGIPVSNSGSTNNYEGQPAIVEDGSGGAIITWLDLRNGNDFDVYAQRVNGSGVLQWPAGGILLNSLPGFQINPRIVTDGSGGAIVSWMDDGLEMDNQVDLRVQRVLNNGTLPWGNEKTVSEAPYKQEDHVMVSDGNGGAFLAWSDWRYAYDANGTAHDVFAQHISSSGGSAWTADGVPVSTYDRNQLYPSIVADGNGGVIITWQDDRDVSINTSNIDLYAQRLNANGAAQWAANGIGIATSTSDFETNAYITTDKNGGAIIAWQASTAYYNSVVLQRVSGSGTKLWTTNGIPLGNAKKKPILTPDNGGVFVFWEDTRADALLEDIYALRLDANGSPLWTSDKAVTNSSWTQQHPQVTTDANGNSIVTWVDNRFNTSSDIYAQRIMADGTLGGSSGGGKSNQVIYFDALPDRKFSAGNFLLTATASSGLAVSYTSSNPAVATVTDAGVTLVGTGTTTITANQAGNDSFNPAAAVEHTLTILKGDQTIIFQPITSRSPGDPDFTLNATASSGLAVIYMSSNTAVATVAGNIVSIKGIGTTNITASQTGDSHYNAAANVVQPFSVKSAQTITFASLPDKTYGDPDFTVSATSSSGLPVTFSVSSLRASVTGNVVKLLVPGHVTIDADQAGNGSFAPAPRVSQTFCINPPKPEINVSDSGTEAPVLNSNAVQGNQWYRDGVAIGGATNQNYTISQDGAYTVIISADGCSSVPSDEKSFIITGVEDTEHLVKVFPNPMQDQLMVDVTALRSSEPLSLAIYDLLGRVMYTHVGNEITAIDVSSFRPGVYLLHIQNDQQRIVKKLKK